MFRQMEKLIMLIDIYEEEVVWVHSVWEKITDKEETRIISKKFWFIKWLVENEKLKWTDKMEMRKIMLWMPEKQDYYIMMLAVTPEPIEFLVSILK